MFRFVSTLYIILSNVKEQPCSSTSFLHHQRPHVPPAQVEGHLAAQALQQVPGSLFQVERALILQEEKKIKDPYKKQTGCEHERRAAANLDGEDQHSTTSHHVEEEDHSFILMRRVGVEDPLGHHVTLMDAQHRRQRLMSTSGFLCPLMFPHQRLNTNTLCSYEYRWRLMDTARHGGNDEADK